LKTEVVETAPLVQDPEVTQEEEHKFEGDVTVDDSV
jgi:hypothetical protein